MAIDRFVKWKKTRPTIQEVRKALKGYVGSAARVTYDGRSRLYASMGKTSSPFRRVMMNCREERFLEVFVDDDNIDVITRQADEFTNDVAAGFQKLCARMWQGELDPYGK